MYTFKKAEQPALEGISLYKRREVLYETEAPLAAAGEYTIAVEFVDAVAEDGSVSVNGKMAKAIRSIMKAIATREHKKVNVEFLD